MIQLFFSKYLGTQQPKNNPNGAEYTGFEVLYADTPMKVAGPGTTEPVAQSAPEEPPTPEHPTL